MPHLNFYKHVYIILINCSRKAIRKLHGESSFARRWQKKPRKILCSSNKWTIHRDCSQDKQEIFEDKCDLKRWWRASCRGCMVLAGWAARLSHKCPSRKRLGSGPWRRAIHLLALGSVSMRARRRFCRTSEKFEFKKIQPIHVQFFQW